jgi:hypothetical protein
MTKRPNSLPIKESQRTAPVATPVEVSKNHFDTDEREGANNWTGVSECKFINSSEKKNKKSTKIILNQRN